MGAKAGQGEQCGIPAREIQKPLCDRLLDHAGRDPLPPSRSDQRGQKLVFDKQKRGASAPRFFQSNIRFVKYTLSSRGDSSISTLFIPSLR